MRDGGRLVLGSRRAERSAGECSVLVTGGNCVGKSTVIRRAAAALRRENGRAAVVTRHHMMTSNPFFERARRYMETSDDLLAMNALLFCSFLWERPRRPPGLILLQDSYVCRVVAWCTARGMHEFEAIYRQGREAFFRFDAHILLTASVEERRRRLARRRGKQTEDDLLLVDRPEIAEAMDRCLRELLAGEANFLEVDTTCRPVQEVVGQVLSHLARVRGNRAGGLRPASGGGAPAGLVLPGGTL